MQAIMFLCEYHDMFKVESDALANEAKRLLDLQKKGVFSHILISGSKEQLDVFYVALVQESKRQNWNALQIIFTAENTNFIYEQGTSEILLIKGLEYLSPEHDQTYKLRTLLDVGQYQGLKSFICCEQSAVGKHFGDYAAPFYKFCLPHRLGYVSADKR